MLIRRATLYLSKAVKLLWRKGVGTNFVRCFFKVMATMLSMKMSFLNYYKVVLEKVSFDHRLFAKEYEKALRSLNPDEIKELQNWLDYHGLREVRRSKASEVIPVKNATATIRS
jgi:hypothetical protein